MTARCTGIERFASVCRRSGRFEPFGGIIAGVAGRVSREGGSLKRICGLSLAALAFCCSLCAYGAPYPNETALRQAIENVAGLARSEGLTVEILDAQKEGVTRPLMAAGLSLTKGTCLIFYNAKPLEELRRFFETIEEKDFALWLDAIAVHELTHCVEQREAYVHRRFDKVLPPGYPRDKVTIQSYLSVVKSGAVETWGEALADIAAVLYLRQVVPQDWMRYAKNFARMRECMAEKFPAHNTAEWLHNIIAADADKAPNQTVFEAAFQLRRRYSPESFVDESEAKLSD